MFDGHEIFVGPSMCGKTSAAMEKARARLAQKIHCLVCDPLHNEWPCTWQTACRDEFIRMAKRCRRCSLFIDEAGQTIDRDHDAEWLFTTARHWGHETNVMAHGGQQLTPTMRAQFGTITIFGCTPRIAELWAEEFNEPGLLAAVTLPRYHFLRKTRFKPLRGPLKLAIATSA